MSSQRYKKKRIKKENVVGSKGIFRDYRQWIISAFGTQQNADHIEFESWIRYDCIQFYSLKL